MAGLQYKKIGLGSGGGSVGKAVASDTRGPRFNSRHQQSFYLNNVYCQLYWKDENKENRGQEWPIFLRKLDLTKRETCVF